MKARVLNFLLLATSLFAYLEWGDKQHLFLFQAELMLFSKLMHDPLALLHPMIVLPFIGQVLLIITLFQKKPNRLYTLLSLSLLGVLNVLVFIVGLLSLNIKIIISSIPFITISIVILKQTCTRRKAINV